MAPIKVQALYEFIGESGSQELSISVNEVLTVTRQDVGEGWWEGTNSQGQTGLFPAAYVVNYETQDFWDEEWDDDDDSQHPENVPVSSSNVNTDAGSEDSKVVLSKINFNRHTTIIRKGEKYILTDPEINIPESDKVKIVDMGSFIVWNPNEKPYICVVDQPKIESKLKGLKTFVSYQLTPSFNNKQVSRRYKHFDWLHLRLQDKYCLIPIPPLPDKQISGRYDGQFIERRKNQLQWFVDCICRHPILSRSSVWEHFITCNDEKKWKLGKRVAEKDELVGYDYFYAIEAPEKSINQIKLEQATQSFSHFTQSMDGAVKNLMEVSIYQIKKWQGLHKNDFQKIGNVFNAFADAMKTDHPSGAMYEDLSSSIRQTSNIYSDIGKACEEQTKKDWEPLSDMLHVYKGFLASIPDILSLHKRMMQTKKECEKLAFDQKMSTSALEKVSRRTDVLSYALLAEINHFYSERGQEVSQSMKTFLKEQVDFFQMVTNKLNNAYQLFDKY